MSHRGRSSPDFLPQASRDPALLPQWHLYRRAIGAPRHQAVLELRSLPELSNEDHSRDGERQNNDETDQRRRPTLVGFSISVLGTAFHRLAIDLAVPVEHSYAVSRIAMVGNGTAVVLRHQAWLRRCPGLGY